MAHIILEILGGLGLFFVGINILSDNIKQLGSGYAPVIIRRFAKNDITGVFSGLMSGIATSSGKAVTFSLVALGEIGALNLRKSLPIVIGGSIGSAFIVLWASIDFQLFIFALIAIAGALYQFGNMKNARLKLITGVILGFGLLFYGLEMMKMGAAPIKELPWFHHYIESTRDHWLLALIIGAVLAFVTQSGSSVAIIAITLVSNGMLGIDEAIMLIFGTNVGSGVITAMLGLSMSGLSRQLVLFHGFFKIVGVAVMVPLLYIEVYAHIPLLKHFVAMLTSSINLQIASIYLLYEIITGVVVFGFLNVIAEWITENADTLSLKPTTVTLSDEHLKVALAYPEGQEVASLKKILADNGINVVVAKTFDSDWLALMEKYPAEVILVNLDEEVSSELNLIEDLLEDSKIPVLFNDITALKAKNADPKVWGATLAEKLYKFAYKRRPENARLVENEPVYLSVKK
jgi:Na/Pi-cotransporter